MPGTVAAASDGDPNPVVERPDDHHGTDEPGRQEFDPFPTALEGFETRAGESGRNVEDVDALRSAEPDVDVESAHDAPDDDSPEEAT